MRCKDIRALLEELADTGHPAESREAVEQHLEACVHCREAARQMRQVAAWLRLAREMPPEPSAGFYPRLRASLAERAAVSAWAWLPIEAYARPLAYALAGVVLALSISLAVVDRPAPLDQAALVEFDSPPATATPPLPAAQAGPVDRNQVMLTLVADSEARP